MKVAADLRRRGYGGELFGSQISPGFKEMLSVGTFQAFSL
jgi:hypothetical protein